MLMIPSMHMGSGGLADTTPYVSVQHVTGTISGTGVSSVDVTINAVDTALTTLMWGGSIGGPNDTMNAVLVRAELINSTTVRFTRGTTSDDTVTCMVSVVYWSSNWVDTIERGTITISAANTSNTATISSITTSRSYVSFLGATSTTSGVVSNFRIPRVVLTNGTTVTASVNTAPGGSDSYIVSYEAVQLKAAKVRSVQYAEFNGTSTNTTENVTISSVTTGDCMLIPNGQTAASGAAGRCFTAELTSSTNVAFVRGQSTSTVCAVGVTVVELISTFAAVENIDATGYVTSAISVTDSISSTDTTKSFLTYQGIRTGAATAYNAAISSVEYSTGGTTTEVTFRRGPTTTLTTPVLKARSHTFTV